MNDFTKINYGLDVPIQNHDPSLALNPSKMAKQIQKIAMSKMKLKKLPYHRPRQVRKTHQVWY
jgi:hypothetical protein